MSGGFNPMNWDCEKRGCFNKLRRPKIEMFSDCFPGTINFGDIDGIVEMNGHFCMLEWKDNAQGLKRAQEIMYRRLTANSQNAVFVVEGDAETMAVSQYCVFCEGAKTEWLTASLDELKADIRAWAAWIRPSFQDFLKRQREAAQAVGSNA